MKIVVISDTHEYQSKLSIPDGDLLIHCGDYSWNGSFDATMNFNKWLGTLPHTTKLLVPGNHDRFFEHNPNYAKQLMTNVTVLIDEEININGVRIYGSPWTPVFMNWSFMTTPEKLKQRWDAIPNGIDILVTHGPPKGILDFAHNKNLGCQHLYNRVEEIKPKFHFFGHIHECNGIMDNGTTTFVNAAICDDTHRPNNQPYIIVI